MLEHGVEENQQLAHAGCEGQLLGLSSGQQPLVEVPDDGVVSGWLPTHSCTGRRGPGRVHPRRCVCPAGCRCLIVTSEPLDEKRWVCSGSPDQIKSDIQALKNIGTDDLCFDPTFSPAGNSLEGFLSTMEQTNQLADAA